MQEIELLETATGDGEGALELNAVDAFGAP